jgi:outer membrane lipoprotein-sorting protein
MSIFDRRPRLRWAVPGGTAILLVGGAALAPLAATADSGLEPRTAQELLVALAQPGATAVSGTVVTSADLGLPELPMGVMPSAGVMALATGENTLRVWTDGPQRQRLALIERAAETTVVRNGQEAWVWSSADATADRYLLPAPDGHGPQGMALDGTGLPPGVDLPSTPQEAAAMALAAIDPSTQVTTSGVGTVAGRDAYELVLTPRDPATLIARVTLSMDAETNVPLRARVYSTAIPDPALDVRFTSVDYGTPDPSLFEFTPPPGAVVTEHPAPDSGAVGGLPAEGTDAPTAGEPTVVGQGWSSIVIMDLPTGSLADLAEDGSRAEGADSASGAALALIEALPSESGAWGTGRVLRGTLFSAILTDDGRVALGAVTPAALAAALAGR